MTAVKYNSVMVMVLRQCLAYNVTLELLSYTLRFTDNQRRSFYSTSLRTARHHHQMKTRSQSFAHTLDHNISSLFSDHPQSQSEHLFITHCFMCSLMTHEAHYTLFDYIMGYINSLFTYLLNYLLTCLLLMMQS